MLPPHIFKLFTITIVYMYYDDLVGITCGVHGPLVKSVLSFTFTKDLVLKPRFPGLFYKYLYLSHLIPPHCKQVILSNLKKKFKNSVEVELGLVTSTSISRIFHPTDVGSTLSAGHGSGMKVNCTCRLFFPVIYGEGSSCWTSICCLPQMLVDQQIPFYVHPCSFNTSSQSQLCSCSTYQGSSDCILYSADILAERCPLNVLGEATMLQRQKRHYTLEISPVLVILLGEHICR